MAVWNSVTIVGIQLWQCGIVQCPHCHTTLPHCPHCHTTLLTYCHTVHTATLLCPHCHTTLPHCPHYNCGSVSFNLTIKKIHRNVYIIVLKSKRTKRRTQRYIVCLIWVSYVRDINFLMEKKLEKKSSVGFFGDWIFDARLEVDHFKRVRQQN